MTFVHKLGDETYYIFSIISNTHNKLLSMSYTMHTFQLHDIACGTSGIGKPISYVLQIDVNIKGNACRSYQRCSPGRAKALLNIYCALPLRLKI